MVGPSFAKEIFYTARQFSAEDARIMGLVNRVVPDAELEAYVKDYADTTAGNAPLTIGAAKFTINEAMKSASQQDLARSAALIKKCFDSMDYVEGCTAFMEKRRPKFTGT